MDPMTVAAARKEIRRADFSLWLVKDLVAVLMVMGGVLPAVWLFFRGLGKAPANAASTTTVNVPGWSSIPIGIAMLLGIGLWGWVRFKEYNLERSRADEDWQDTKRLEAEMTLPSLLRLNRKMLDGYHAIAIGQANKSFRSSQIAMGIGYGLVIACGVAALRVPSTETKVTVAALGSVGAALSAFLQRTYLRVYDRSLEQLNRYFDQPLVNSHYLTAERILAHDDQDPELVKKLVTQVIETARVPSSAVGVTHPVTAKVTRPRARRKGAAEESGKADAAASGGSAAS